MSVFHSLFELPERRPTAVAIGVFDGVHRGHQALLKTMMASAKANQLRTAVVTFFPHPKAVLQPIEGRFYLTSVEDRVQLLQRLGIDVVVVLPFDEQMRHKRAAQFVQELQDGLQMSQLWSGDFGFGYQREGTADFLRPLGEQNGFTVHEYHEMMTVRGARVSSSRIRQGLLSGNLEDASACLGRSYRLSGKVIEGDKQGRRLGFPTANLDVWPSLVLPGNGVYAAVAYLRHERFAAATNIGVRPTVDGQQHRLEPHLLDFSEDIYGETLILEFVARIRPEKKFNGIEELQVQIAADVAQVRQILL